MLTVFAETTPGWPAVFTKAEALAAAHASANLCRTLDTLHVALAQELGATEFCTFDLRQAAMARAASLAVVPEAQGDVEHLPMSEDRGRSNSR